MQIITDKDKTKIVPYSKAKVSPVRRQAFSLKPKQSFFLPEKEWKSYKYKKGTTLGSLLYHPKIKFNTKKVKWGTLTGWTVERRK